MNFKIDISIRKIIKYISVYIGKCKLYLPKMLMFIKNNKDILGLSLTIISIILSSKALFAEDKKRKYTKIKDIEPEKVQIFEGKVS